MCGLIGILAKDLRPEGVTAINNLLTHRGPDDGALFLGEGVALGARRLSIIDVAGGRQPLCNEDGTIWLAYNGEVFNAPQLRAKLEPAGHIFRTHSDTETLVHAYEEWGMDMVAQLRGMFAFALWDGRRRRLLLARDRFGIKPMYYAHSPGRFACASEIAPILAAMPHLTPQANPEALWRLFEIGFIPSPLTPFQHIYKLPAGHTLCLENDQLQLQAYWQLAPAGTPPADPAQYFLDYLRETMAAWRTSDVPVGALLSGGLDSSTLAYWLTELNGGSIHTFNIAFTAASHDESAQAQATANFLGSQHHQLIFSEADFNLLPQVVSRLEEPQCAATSIPLYLLYKACHEAGFKVIMTGEGADELLAGYHWFDGDRRLRPWLAWPRPIRSLLARLPLAVSPAGRRVLGQGNGNAPERYGLWQELAPAGTRHQLLGQSRTYQPLSQLWQQRYQAQLAGRHPLDQFLFLESQTRMIDFINFEVDRMSMANSVEARPPFLDHLLWEFCAKLPADLKLSPEGNKLLLRRVMSGRLPPAVTNRPKQGLATPHAAWWRQPRLPAWAEEALAPSALAETGYFSPPFVQQLRQAHGSGRDNHSQLLMGILTTQLWHQIFRVRN